MTTSALHRDDWRVMALVFVLASTVYVATGAGITSSNDGSHYALVRALADRASFEISPYLAFTEDQDYAFNGDRRFTDRPPGTALAAAPVYVLAGILPAPSFLLPSKHDAGNRRIPYVLMVPAAAMAATAVLLYALLRAPLGLARSPALVTTLAFAFGTMGWKYGSVLYSHATSALTLLGALTLLARGAHTHGPGRAWLTGLLLGATVLMEYSNLPVSVLGALWWLAQRPPRQQWGWFLAGGLIPAVFLAVYNTVNFGAPWEVSTYHVNTEIWAHNASFQANFAVPMWVGVPAMLFYHPPSGNQGLFLLAPITLLGLAGLPGLWRRSRPLAVATAGVFTGMVLFFSTAVSFNPYTNDGRYMTSFLPFWFVAVGFGVAALEHRARAALAWPTAVLYGLLFLSVRNQVIHIALAWGHGLAPEALRPLAVAPENLVLVAQAVLPNLGNVPVWWGLLLAGWFVGEGGRLGWRRLRQWRRSA